MPVQNKSKTMFEKIKAYFIDSYTELTTKVTWPTWPDLRASASVVLIAALIIALLIGLLDGASNVLFSKIIYKIAG